MDCSSVFSKSNNTSVSVTSFTVEIGVAVIKFKWKINVDLLGNFLHWVSPRKAKNAAKSSVSL